MASSSTLNNLQVNKLQANELIVTGQKPKFTMEDFDILKKILIQGYYIGTHDDSQYIDNKVEDSRRITVIFYKNKNVIEMEELLELKKVSDDKILKYKAVITYSFSEYTGKIQYDKYTVNENGHKLSNNSGEIIEINENSYKATYGGNRISVDKIVLNSTVIVENNNGNIIGNIYDDDGALLIKKVYKPMSFFNLF